MKIREKILIYCNEKGISQKEFAEELNIPSSQFNNMLQGRQRFTQDFFFGIIERFPDIDLNKLISDDNKEITKMVSEEREPYGSIKKNMEIEYKNALSDIKNIIDKLI